MQATLSSAELVEWYAYYSLEPWGQTRTDDGNRMLAALLYNANRGKGARPIEPGEFLKTPHDMRPQAVRPGELGAKLKAAFAGMRKA